MLAALLEWFLWVAAFLYCLVKVYQKAETLSIKILAIVMMFAFTALRYVSAVSSTDPLSLMFD
jgi:chitin synthase